MSGHAGLAMDTMDGVRMLRESERKHRHSQVAPSLGLYHPGLISAAPQDVIETVLSRLQLRTCAARRCDAEDVHLSCVGCGQGMAVTVPFSVSSSASQFSFPAQLHCQLLCPGRIARSHPLMLEWQLQLELS